MPSQYIHKVRIEKSKELLTDTKYSIIEIALQVGYINNASFTRAFKKSEGISPREYRYSSNSHTIPGTDVERQTC